MTFLKWYLVGITTVTALYCFVEWSMETLDPFPIFFAFTAWTVAAVYSWVKALEKTNK